MENALTRYIAILVVPFLISSCGTLLGSQQSISVTSDPPNADIKKGNRTVDKTPGRILLDTNNPNEYNFYVDKEGYSKVEVNMTTSPSAGIILGDIIFGGIPLLIDAAAGNLDRFNTTSKSVVLKSKEKNTDSTQNKSRTKNTENLSVFSDEERNNPNKSDDQTQKNKDKNNNQDNKQNVDKVGIFSEENKNGDTEENKEDTLSTKELMPAEDKDNKRESLVKKKVSVKNSNFEDFNKLNGYISSMDSTSIVKKELVKDTSKYILNTHITSTEIVTSLKSLSKFKLQVELLSDKEIIVIKGE